MRRFIVTNASETEFIDHLFTSPTEIRSIVDLPFTDVKYRCTMFTGIDIKLVHKEKIIEGTLR